jgi:hypothetical protein
MIDRMFPPGLIDSSIASIKIGSTNFQDIAIQVLSTSTVNGGQMAGKLKPAFPPP